MPHSLSLPADTTPATARARLTRLQAERYEAAGATGAYVRHLDAAIAAARAEYTVAAVTELAALRATLGSALQG